jgi:hypothetical protein
MQTDIETITVDRTNKNKSKMNPQWWTDDDVALYKSVFGHCQAVGTKQTSLLYNQAKFQSLYENKDRYLVGANNLITAGAVRTGNRMTLNIVKSCINSVCAKVSKEKTRIQFLTNDGTVKLQKKAEKLTQYVDGLFDATNTYGKGQSAFRDACIYGTGLVKIYAEDDEVKLERVLLREMIVDEVDALYGDPRQIHRQKLVSKEVLIGMFPDMEDKIKSAAVYSEKGSVGAENDKVLVIESWHIPSSKKATDGKHSICINSATLFSEEYTKDYFPFVWYHWEEPSQGWHGTGLAEELMDLQAEISTIIQTIQLSQKIACYPRVYMQAGSNVTPNAFKEIGGVIKYTGAQPMIAPSPACPPEYYQHLWKIKDEAYQIAGVSEAAISGEKPAGLDSAVSLREYADISSERFNLQSQRLQVFYKEIARIMIDVSKDIFEANKGLAIKTSSNKFVKTIKWKEVDMDEDKYELTSFPVNLMPITPAGKLAFINNMLQAGLIDKAYAKSLLDYPDVNKFLSLDSAALDLAQMMVENMLEGGEYIAPEEFMNIPLTLQITLNEYLKAKLSEKYSDSELDNVRQFMTDLKALANPPPDASAAPPSAPGPNPMQGAPAPTMPPPQGAPMAQ